MGWRRQGNGQSAHFTPSQISVMRFNSLINGLTALIGLSTLAAALPQASTLNERLTNAQLLARGKAPLKPAKLYDPSKVNGKQCPVGSTVLRINAG